MFPSSSSSLRLTHLKQWQNEELFDLLLAADYDEADFVNKALLSGPAKLLSSLQAGLQEITEEIRHQVVSNHSGLLEQTAHIEAIEEKLVRVTNRINMLKTSMKRVETELQQPFKRIVSWTRRAADIQAASDVLRRCHRVSQLSRKLDSLISVCQKQKLDGRHTELIKAAQLLSELESVLNDDTVALDGVYRIEGQLAGIRKQGLLVRKLGRDSLDHGLEMQDQVTMSRALVVFFTLNELPTVVYESLRRTLLRMKSNLDSVLDVSRLPSYSSAASSSASAPASSTAASSIRAAIWSQVDNFSDSVLTDVEQMWNLQVVLSKRSDPNTQQSFLQLVLSSEDCQQFVRESGLAAADDDDGGSDNGDDASSGMVDATVEAATFSFGPSPSLASITSAVSMDDLRGGAGGDRVGDEDNGDGPRRRNEWSLLQQFWFSATRVLLDAFEQTASGSTVVKDVFVNEMPNLYRVFDSLFSRIQRCTHSPTTGISGPQHRLWLMHSLRIFKLGFLKQSLLELNTLIDLMFPEGASVQPPTNRDVTRLAHEIVAQLKNVTGAAEELQVDAVLNVNKAVKLFAHHAEQITVAKTHELWEERGNHIAPAPSQLYNAKVFAASASLDKSLMWAQLPSEIQKDFGSAAERALAQSSVVLHEVMSYVLGLLMEAFLQHIDVTLQKLLSENFDKPAASTLNAASGSSYMARVELHVTNFINVMLPLYETPRTLLAHRKELARHKQGLCTHIAQLFIRYAGLIRPLSDAGKAKLVNDMAVLERVLRALVPEQSNRNSFESVDKLRVFKDVVFVESDDAIDQPCVVTALGDTDMALAAVHHLISRHETADGQSPLPHDVLGKALNKYWHSVDDNKRTVTVWNQLEGVIQSLVAGIPLPKTEKRDEHFRTHYPSLAAALHIVWHQQAQFDSKT